MTEKNKVIEEIALKIPEIGLILLLVLFISYFLFGLLWPFVPYTEEVKEIEPIDITTFNFEEMNSNECYWLLNKEEQEKREKGTSTLLTCESIIKKALNDCPYELKRISDMNKARARHKAIKLNDGKILILGGDQDISAEIFNPETNQFTLINKNIKPYLTHDVAIMVSSDYSNPFNDPILLPSGRVYYQGSVYNPKTTKFTKATRGEEKKLLDFFKKITSKKWLKLKDFTLITIFPDSKTLFAKDCKYDKYVRFGCAEVFLVDPLTDNKYLPGKLNVKRERFSVFILNNKNILVMGGQITDNNGGLLGINSSEFFNPITGKINLIEKFNAYKPIKLKNGKLFVINLLAGIEDYNTTLFDPDTLENAPLPFNLAFDSKKYLLNDNFVFAINWSYASILDLNNNKEYNLWNPNLYGNGQTFTPLDNGNLLITGGNYIDLPLGGITELSKYAGILTLKEN